MKYFTFRLVVILFLFLSLTFGSFSITGVSCPTERECAVNEDVFVIIDAFYADLDGDNLEDDIRVISTLDLRTDGTKEVFLTGLFFLELPSQTIYDHSFSHHYCTDLDVVYLTFTGFDAATEPGWYSATILGLGFIDSTPIIFFDDIVFDPPGGSDNGDPLIVDESPNPPPPPDDP